MHSHFPRKVWREIACSFQNISIVIVQKSIETFIRFQDEYDYEYEIFSIFLVVLAREPASFSRENVVAVVSPLRVLARVS